MVINFFFSSFQSLLISIILSKILLKNENKLIIIEIAIFGLIFLSFLAVLINFIFPLNQLINTTLYFFIIIFFFQKKKKIYIKELLIILFVSLISLFLIVYDTVNRPDAYLYHLPYNQIINNEKIILGLSNLHFRFAHISIIQYLSSINYTYFTNTSAILSPIAIFWSLILIFYINDILKLIKKKEKLSTGKIFSIFVLIYISYKINRYSEFGNDMTGHLTIFYIVSKYLYHNRGDKFNLYLICTLVAFAIANKIFFIPVIIIPIFIILDENFNFLKFFLKLPFLLIIIWFFKNILISGCIIYPIHQTCSEQLSWTNKSQIKNERISGEAWAKAWPQRTNFEISMEQFNANFNWINAWSKLHMKLIINIIFPFIFLILLTSFIVKGKKKLNSDFKKELVILTFSFIGIILFFFKFPLYRYGYSFIIIFIIIFFKIYFFKHINHENFIKFCIISLTFCILVLVGKQTIRIINFWQTRVIIPEIKSNVDFEKKFKKVVVDSEFSYYFSEGECYYEFYPCTNQDLKNLKYKKINNYKILYNLIQK